MHVWEYVLRLDIFIPLHFDIQHFTGKIILVEWTFRKTIHDWNLAEMEGEMSKSFGIAKDSFFSVFRKKNILFLKGKLGEKKFIGSKFLSDPN